MTDETRHPGLLGIAAEHPQLAAFLHDLHKRIEKLEDKDAGWQREPPPEDVV